MWAYVVDGVVMAWGGLPGGGHSQVTDEWIDQPETEWTNELLEEIGYYPVVETVRPADTETTTHQESVEYVAGVLTQVWTAVPMPPEVQISWRENALLADIALEVDVLIAIRTAQRTNLLDIANATINANPAQYIKDAVRWDRDAEKSLLKIARVVSRKLNSTDVGGV